MHVHRFFGVTVIALLLASSCGGTTAVRDEAAPGSESSGDAPADEVIPLVGANVGSTPDCIRVTGRAIYGALAYNHWVYIDNECDVAADCTVRTDVAPDPIEVEVAAGAREEVTTFVGSPASDFTPNVDCDLR